MSNRYPFTALVGQELLKEALIWLAIDPRIGGLLVTGTRGTAKSTSTRALADLLPPIRVISGDDFNRMPDSDELESTTIATPFVELPVGSTEDRIIGTLDVRSLLTTGEHRFEPGLLARANRGILYVDEVNLLPDHLVDVLLDAAATGKNIVERDGVSFSHDSRIVLVGTMNPEEGELRPQLLDRFGLCVEVYNDGDIARRVQIIERRMQFDENPVAFTSAYLAESTQLRTRIEAAREMLPLVVVDRESLEYAATLATEAFVEGMRADLTIIRTARAIAAFDRRNYVQLEDIRNAAIPALAHRRREAPRSSPPKPPSSNPPSGPTSERRNPSKTEQTPVTFDLGPLSDPDFERKAETHYARRAPNRTLSRGKNSNILPNGISRVVTAATEKIAPLATIRAAAYKRGASKVSLLPIESRHFRYIEKHGRERQLVVFLIDASGSMAAARRMSAAKGVVCALLEDAHYRRDAVSMIAFRGNGAEIIVPPTRSASFAYRRLKSLVTGGRTPLADGLRCAREIINAQKRKDAGYSAHLVIVSDARANAPEQNPFDRAMKEATLLRMSGLRALCIDTETGRIRLGHAARLAHELDATYRHLDDCSPRALGAAVREWMASA